MDKQKKMHENPISFGLLGRILISILVATGLKM
ncbi:MAG: virulence promoting factor [Planctomycetaceae bacterium]|nr:virulence promoting factor [Planctomycetaceae bacterium]